MPPPAERPKLSVVRDVGDDGQEDYAAGEIISDKYQLVSVIGDGGMGSVWLARNVILHIDVAIKLVHRKVASEEAKQRLLIEARSAAQLGHPSIVRVHDFGTTARGDSFIVMELLNGESLADVIHRQGGLPEINAVQMLLPIASALAAAHGRGIVHRDLKPDNIILVADEAGIVVPKLVDFGIAKMESAPSDPTPLPFTGTRRASGRLTQVGRLIGSPQYMAPEQARGDFDVDERADIWAFCVVLYETLAGAAPFEHEDVEQLLIKILAESPTPLPAVGVGDTPLWRVLERGLTKDRDRRWQSARLMGEALARWLLAKGVEADIAGTAIRQHWQLDLPGERLSDPPLSGRGLVQSDPLRMRSSAPRSSRPPSLEDIEVVLEAGETATPASIAPGPTSAEAVLVSLPPPKRRRKLPLLLLLLVLGGGGYALWTMRARLPALPPWIPFDRAPEAAAPVEPRDTAPEPSASAEPEPLAEAPAVDAPTSATASASAEPPRPRRPRTRRARSKDTGPKTPEELTIPDQPNY